MPGAWSGSPATYTPSELINDTIMNAELRDRMLWLGGTGGIITQAVSAVASGGNPTTVSASPVPLADPALTITTLAGSYLIAIAEITVANTTLGAINSLFLGLGGSATMGGVKTFTQGAANNSTTLTLTAVSTNTGAGVQTLQVYWACSAGTLTRNGVLEGIVALEIRR